MPRSGQRRHDDQLYAETVPVDDPCGLCLYRSGETGALYVFANDHGGAVGQWRRDVATRLALTTRQMRRSPPVIRPPGPVTASDR